MWSKGTFVLKFYQHLLNLCACRNTVDLENKIGNQELRFLEEEGFYVPKRPQISTRHECFLEQRLSRDNK